MPKISGMLINRTVHTPQGHSSASSNASQVTSDSGQVTDLSPESINGSSNEPFLPDITEDILRSDNLCLYRMPIIGYEVLEERSRFTIFKIQIIHQPTGDRWFVFRRYTDFVRLNSKLQKEFPGLRFALPPKRWFGNNFDPIFLEDRQLGLQAFIDNIIAITKIRNTKAVRNFFCLDNPPNPFDSLEESRAVCHNLEETVADLQDRLREKNGEISYLQSKVDYLLIQQETLIKALRLECELEGDDRSGDQSSTTESTHNLNVAFLSLCEQSLRGSQQAVGKSQLKNQCSKPAQRKYLAQASSDKAAQSDYPLIMSQSCVSSSQEDNCNRSVVSALE